MILGAFNDLDYMWMSTEKGFQALQIILKKTPEEMIEYLLTDEKLVDRPFGTIKTRELFESYIADRKSELLREIV